jgi:hypothetical protein
MDLLEYLRTAERRGIVNVRDEQLNTAPKRAIGSAFAVENLLDYEHDVEVTAGVSIDKILKMHTIDLFDTL